MIQRSVLWFLSVLKWTCQRLQCFFNLQAQVGVLLREGANNTYFLDSAISEMSAAMPRIGFCCCVGGRGLHTRKVHSGAGRNFDSWISRSDDVFPYEDTFVFDEKEVDSSTVLELLEPFVSAERRAKIAEVD